jgi:hypothetical protein
MGRDWDRALGASTVGDYLRGNRQRDRFLREVDE